jgi:CHAT domain-containing protein
VLVVPDSVLAYLPFRLLFPEREVTLVPSGTAHGLLLAEGDREGRGVLALGNPDYGESSEGSGPIAMRWGKRLAPLPGSEEEARTVGSVVLLGRKASVSGLLKSLETRERWRAVHFACHGRADPQRPLLSALALAPDPEHDGYLSALDVFRSRVPADLVVLSACESGRGRVYRAEGLIGLTRAFMLAGSPRVIASLWKVDDVATQALMVEFYRLWNPKQGPGLPAAAALSKAQDFVRGHQKWKHPRHWAAWVLWGLPE